MASEYKRNLPQASKPFAANLAANSDRVEALVVGAGSMDFGGSQTHEDIAQERNTLGPAFGSAQTGSGTSEVDHLASVAHPASSEGEAKRQAAEAEEPMDIVLEGAKESPEHRDRARRPPTIEARSHEETGGEKTQALKRLGELITKLHEFIKDKKNIHHEAKRMAASVKNAFNKLYELEKTVGDVPTLAITGTTVGATQTTPTLGKRQNEKPRKEGIPTPAQQRSQGNKRKERTPPSREREATRKKEKGDVPKHSDGPKRSDGLEQSNGPKQRKGPKANMGLKDIDEAKQSNGSIHSAGPKITKRPTGNKKRIGEWQEVRRKPRAQRRKPTRPNALIIKKKGDLSYAEILSKVKKDPKLEEVGKRVLKTRRTVEGELILILDKTSPAETAEMRSAIGEALGQEAAVTSRLQEKIVEIKDLDEATTKEEICECLAQQLGVAEGSLQDSIKSIRKAYGGTQTAVVRLAADRAKEVIEAGKIRIGWVVCRVREQLKPDKCYKCWDYGHLARNCRAEIDRSDSCMKCGKIGHKIAECKGEAHCVLCDEQGSKACRHIAGSIRCPAYSRALREQAQKRR